MKQNELNDFAEELFQNGCSLLPCGGGVTFEPLKAISKLENKYGTNPLKQLCFKLLFSAPVPVNDLEGVIEVAQGILYHLADEGLLKKLFQLHENQIIGADGKHNVERLIAGICNKLDLPTPEGITPLDFQEEHFLFRQEEI